MFKNCCFTGYRPQKFPFALAPNSAEYMQFENKLTDAIFSLPDEKCFTFYSGAAMGFDLIAAETVLLLREAYHSASVRLICAVPFPEQAARFDVEWKKRYDAVLAAADETIVLSGRYHSGCFQLRNMYMVDHSDIVLTWYDGKPGGTRNTLLYAQKKERRIVNLHGSGVHEYLNCDDYDIISDDED